MSFGTLVLQQIAKPRLPVYTLQVVKFPSIKYVHNKLLTQLTTDVSLHNDNFMQINVHALTFDLFTADWEGNLHHIGLIQDSQSAAFDLDKIKNVPLDSVWEIAARADFTTTDQLFIDITSPSNLLTTSSRLLYSLWYGSGSLLLPTTGVAYIKANAKTPFTVSIICDNVVNVWRMSVVGIECALHSLNPGWNNMSKAVHRVRRHAELKLTANMTGGILTHPKQNRSDIIRRIAWEEQMHTTV